VSNPTNPFSWQMPTPTDLVTDLPADFEVFGQAVATSLADLLGGTTDQVLAKNSNTDMDFKWVTSDDANAIQNSIVNAKGDLIAASANDTPAILSVGANDLLLTAASGEATGLKYSGAWTTWTPSVTNFVKGNGTEVARYAQVGKTVFIEYSFTFGSTSSISGLPAIPLPINYKGSLPFAPVGNVMFEDRDTAFYFGSVMIQASNNWFLCYLDKVDGTYTRDAGPSATVPFTWATNDRFLATLNYEVN
jgi:hypothetical protein